MAERTFKGTYTALVTPMRDGAVDYASLEALVDKQIADGVDGLVAVGTTGESPTLDNAEHMEVIACCVRRAAGRVQVIAGTGSNSTTEAVALTREAEKAGADAMLQVTPYYNKPTQAGLVEHFSRVAEATSKPIMLYSIPGRCVIDIAVDTAATLYERFPHVCALKESAGDADRVSKLVAALGPAYSVLSGEDALTLPYMSVGASGVVSVASNVTVSHVSRMVKAALANDYATARDLHLQLYPLFNALFVEPNPGPAKYALAKMGILASDEIRSPLLTLSPSEHAGMDRVLRELGLI